MNMHRPDPLARRLTALVEENETLREEVRQLRQALAPSLLIPEGWGLTPSEARLLSALRAVGARILTRNRALVAMCDREHSLPQSDNVLSVLISRIRSKLSRAGQPPMIETVPWQGYRLTPEGLATLDAALSREAEAAARPYPILTPDSERGASPLDQGAVR